MNTMIEKVKSTINRVDVTGKSNKGLFSFDSELNAWVRVDANLDKNNRINVDELVLTDKEQSDLWYAW